MNRQGKDAEKSGRYLYAVTAGFNQQAYDSIGIEGSLVYAISHGNISAVVSDVPNDKIRPERRKLAAHQEVLRRLMETATPLPMSFGIIADSAAAVKNILESNRQSFLEQLRRVEGKVEMGLRATWDVPNIFEYFVMTHAELKVLRDRFFGTHREPTQEQKIELGRTFDRLLKEDREEYAEQVSEILSRHCFEIKENKCTRESEVMNLACLVGREVLPRFEEAIFEAANRFDDSFAFDYNGPWAPHNFVDIDLRL